MFISRKEHARQLAQLTEFHAREIERYQSERAVLSAQIEDLRRLVFAPATQEVPPVHQELHQVLSVSDQPLVELTEEEWAELNELDSIISGTYDEPREKASVDG